MYLAPASLIWMLLFASLFEFPQMARDGALQIMAQHPALFTAAASMGFGVMLLSFFTIQLCGSLTLKVLPKAGLTCSPASAHVPESMAACHAGHTASSGGRMTSLCMATVVSHMSVQLQALSAQCHNMSCPCLEARGRSAGVHLTDTDVMQVLGTVKNAALVMFCVVFLAEQVTPVQGSGYMIALAGFSWCAALPAGALNNFDPLCARAVFQSVAQGKDNVANCATKQPLAI